MMGTFTGYYSTVSPPAWAARAPELAHWSWTHLVNRTDVWGGYLSFGCRKRVSRPDGSFYEQKSTTKPATSKRGSVVLTEDVLVRHFEGRDVGNIAGLHSTSPGGACRWAGIDVDAHSGQESNAEANRNAALAWYAALTACGHVVLLTDSNGKGGYHLLILFDESLPAPRVHAFVQSVVADYASHGLRAAPETFPKQAALRSEKKCGNWLRLPGRHHSTDHWSGVWDGSRWLEGAKAVQLILALVPGAAALVPEPRAPLPCPKPMSSSLSTRPGLRTDAEIAVDCLNYLVHLADDYDSWLEVGMALHSVDSGPDMLGAWDAWSQKSRKYTDGECESKWRTFHAGGGKRIGTLIKLARDAGFDVFARGRNGDLRTWVYQGIDLTPAARATVDAARAAGCGGQRAGTRFDQEVAFA
jgi:hypothetical protein